MTIQNGNTVISFDEEIAYQGEYVTIEDEEVPKTGTTIYAGNELEGQESAWKHVELQEEIRVLLILLVMAACIFYCYLNKPKKNNQAEHRFFFHDWEK